MTVCSIFKFLRINFEDGFMFSLQFELTAHRLTCSSHFCLELLLREEYILQETHKRVLKWEMANHSWSSVFQWVRSAALFSR